MMDFGKSRAKLANPNGKKVTFNDVAGLTYLQKLRNILLVSYLSMRSMQLQDEEALDLVVDMMNVNRH